MNYVFKIVDNKTGYDVSCILSSKSKLSAIDLACKVLGFDAEKKGSALEFFQRYSIISI